MEHCWGRGVIRQNVPHWLSLLVHMATSAVTYPKDRLFHISPHPLYYLSFKLQSLVLSMRLLFIALFALALCMLILPPLCYGGSIAILLSPSLIRPSL